MRLRPATAEDLPALLELEARCYTSDLSTPEDWQDAVTHPKREGYLLEVDGQLVGSLLLRVTGRTVRIYGIQVDPMEQGKGYGRRLLQHAERRAVDLGRSAVSLEVRRDNEPALAMYTAAGYHRVGTIRNYYADGETAIRMSKDVA